MRFAFVGLLLKNGRMRMKLSHFLLLCETISARMPDEVRSIIARG